MLGLRASSFGASGLLCVRFEVLGRSLSATLLQLRRAMAGILAVRFLKSKTAHNSFSDARAVVVVMVVTVFAIHSVTPAS